MRKSTAKATARQAVMRGRRQQRAEQERADWLASQVEPGALHPHGSIEHPCDVKDASPEAAKALRTRPRAEAPDV
jgi:hypothetical protein